MTKKYQSGEKYYKYQFQARRWQHCVTLQQECDWGITKLNWAQPIPETWKLIRDGNGMVIKNIKVWILGYI